MNTLVRLGVLALRPVEVWWSWQYNRALAKGKYLRPERDAGAVTTKR